MQKRTLNRCLATLTQDEKERVSKIILDNGIMGLVKDVRKMKITKLVEFKDENGKTIFYKKMNEHKLIPEELTYNQITPEELTYNQITKGLNYEIVSTVII